MKLNFLLMTAILALVVKAQDEIDSDDFPPVCASACQSLVGTTERCDDTTDGDAAYLACVCSSADASNLLPSCGACIRSNGGDADNEAIELAFRCGFAIPSSSSRAIGSATSTGTAMTTSSSSTTFVTSTTASTTLSTSKSMLLNHTALPTAQKLI